MTQSLKHMIRKTILLSLTMMSLFLSSCRKDSSLEIQDPNYPSGPDENWYNQVPADKPILALKNILKKPFTRTSFYYNGTLDTVLRSGLQIKIESGSLQNANGTTATGNIIILWNLLERRGDVIRQLAACPNGQFEEASSLLFIKFLSSNNDTLLPSNDFKMRIEYTPDYPVSMGLLQLFYARESFPDVLNWETVPTGKIGRAHV